MVDAGWMEVSVALGSVDVMICVSVPICVDVKEAVRVTG